MSTSDDGLFDFDEWVARIDAVPPERDTYGKFFANRGDLDRWLDRLSRIVRDTDDPKPNTDL